MFLSEPGFEGHILTVQYCKQPVMQMKNLKNNFSISLNQQKEVERALNFCCGFTDCVRPQLNLAKQKQKEKKAFDIHKYCAQQQKQLDAIEQDEDLDEDEKKEKAAELGCAQCGDITSESFVCTKKHLTCSACMIDLVKKRLLHIKTTELFKFQSYKITPDLNDN